MWWYAPSYHNKYKLFRVFDFSISLVDCHRKMKAEFSQPNCRLQVMKPRKTCPKYIKPLACEFKHAVQPLKLLDRYMIIIHNKIVDLGNSFIELWLKNGTEWVWQGYTPMRTFTWAMVDHNEIPLVTKRPKAKVCKSFTWPKGNSRKRYFISQIGELDSGSTDESPIQMLKLNDRPFVLDNSSVLPLFQIIVHFGFISQTSLCLTKFKGKCTTI